jgi:hypothetical protein
MIEELASYRRCMERMNSSWSTFLEKRSSRLAQQERYGEAAEKVAENILEDLFTGVLDWSLSDLNNQVEYADMLLTTSGIKHLLLEVKRPGSLAWSRRNVEIALDQARRYADEQKVKCIGVSDGYMLYSAEVKHGGIQDRIFVSLESPDAPKDLWWLSVHGIYRSREDRQDASVTLLPEILQEESPQIEPADETLLHPKYKIPARCFAFVGHAGDPKTWKLPYCNYDGSIDLKRLPKAVQAILSNYRGTKVSGIPEAAIPDVLVRLACAAASLGKMPHQSGETAQIYQQLEEALDQLGRKDEIMKR